MRNLHKTVCAAIVASLALATFAPHTKAQSLLRDSVADIGLVEGGGDAEAREDCRREFAIGMVDAGGDEDVIASME